jgi:hypothetical protein
VAASTDSCWDKASHHRHAPPRRASEGAALEPGCAAHFSMFFLEGLCHTGRCDGLTVAGGVGRCAAVAYRPRPGERDGGAPLGLLISRGMNTAGGGDAAPPLLPTWLVAL